MGEPETKYWFRAKRYGWGWGLPLTWQGWVVMIVWLAMLMGSAPLLRVHPPWVYGVFVIAMIVILVAICFAKGEPPRWRWGDRDPPGSSLRGDVRDRQR
jgi:hypothetical protein